MQEFKNMWEDWYADLLTMHQWHELEYRGREIPYVHGVTHHTGDDGAFPAAFIQVIGHLDQEAPLNEEEQREIRELLRGRHGLENICFWSA